MYVTLLDSDPGTIPQPTRRRVLSILNRTDMGWRLEGNARLKWLGGLVAAMIVSFCLAAPASAQTRSLKLYFIHTKEKAEITYMRNGRYDQRGLEQVNRFLRDWRRNEPAKMDPKLLDVVWQVYQAVGARDYIHVVSAYRSPATNNMLRGRSSGVAENSQHTRGKAMDFYIPGVPLAKLRAAAFKIEGGGVGYYPKSGSPFVHLDVGNVRSWPRMSRSELMALFPDGRTIHVPADGKPLPGYQQAMAAYKSRSGAPVQIASASPSAGESGAPSRGLLSAIFGGGNNARPSETVREAPVAAQRPAAAPRLEAPQPAAPVAAPAETIIAALPERSAPVPGAAPRPLVAIGAPAAAPLIAGLPERPVAPVSVDETATALALNVPLPSPRPNYAPSVAPAAPVQVAAATPAVEADMPIAAIAAERGSAAGSTAIAEMLAATASDKRADVVFTNHPIPTFRPSLDNAGERQVAALSGEQGAGDVFVLASLPSTEQRSESAELKAALRAEIPDVATIKNERNAALSASPRQALIARSNGSDVSAALDSGVRTTAKSSKPRAEQARPDPRAVAIPVQKELTRWAFVRDLDVKSAGGTAEPAKAHDIVRAAPKTVYTAGFQQVIPNADVNRFSGKAVTFMSVARFN